MGVFRAIFRVDFALNYAIVDGPGEVLRILIETRKDFWTNYSENKKSRAITAEKAESTPGGRTRQMSVEPAAIWFQLESRSGIGADELAGDEDFQTMLELVDILVGRFKIQTFLRAGIRFLAIQNVVGVDVVERFRLMTYSPILDSVKKVIGSPNDYGFSFDGGHEDALKYHLMIGPYQVFEARKYSEFLREALASRSDLNFSCDMDLYEENFSMKGRSPSLWTKPATKRLTEIIKSLSTAMLVSKESI